MLHAHVFSKAQQATNLLFGLLTHGSLINARIESHKNREKKHAKYAIRIYKRHARGYERFFNKQSVFKDKHQNKMLYSTII